MGDQYDIDAGLFKPTTGLADPKTIPPVQHPVDENYFSVSNSKDAHVALAGRMHSNSSAFDQPWLGHIRVSITSHRQLQFSPSIRSRYRLSDASGDMAGGAPQPYHCPFAGLLAFEPLMG